MPAILPDLTRAAAPLVVDICLIAFIAVNLALVVVLIAAAIVALASKDAARRKDARALVRLLRWRGWGWHRDDEGSPG